jgi:hypothetical protein
MTTTHARFFALVAGATLFASAAFAQETGQGGKNTVPDANPPAQNLSKELSKSNGVIPPKEVDPAIQKPAPKTGDTNVVPPPGSSGGSAAPQPK